MKTRRFAGFILISLLLSLLGFAIYRQALAAPTATTYYVCDCQPGADGNCTAGSDANSGTSPLRRGRLTKKRALSSASWRAGMRFAFARAARLTWPAAAPAG
ncbi:MAG: hypothetical protein H6652_07350 [Ardenticatenaceae bacterium]|nr:hypothetical protein [Ardenticatenaceae bacterium]